MASHGKKRKGSSPPSRSGNVEDRISALPDHLLHQILSFLNMREVIATSRLSTRWRCLWTSTPTLDFGKREDASGGFRISWGTDAIAIALVLYESPKIEKFHVSSNFRRFDFNATPHVDSWIRFAVRHRVEELDLDLAGGFHPLLFTDEGVCKLHRCLFTCESVVVLRLRFCSLNLPNSVHLRLLKTLELCFLNLTDVDIQILTSGCPLLENLAVLDCNRNCDLNVHIPNRHLKSLRIREFNTVGTPFQVGITIFAPHVLSLELCGNFRSFYNVQDISSIVSASIGFEHMLNYEYYGQVDQLVGLLHVLSHAKNLKLCAWCIQVLAVRKVADDGSKYLRATCLELNTGLSKWDLLGMAHLLRSSHHLGSLVINISEKSIFFRHGGRKLCDNLKEKFDEKEYWKSLELSLSCQFSRLKIIKIDGFMGSKSFSLKERQRIESCTLKGRQRIEIDKLVKRRKNEVELVRFLLGNSKMLDKLIIGTTNTKVLETMKSELLLNLTERLLVLPRASQKAEIIFT